MPTAARLVGALIFAALAFLVSSMTIPLLAEGTPTGSFGLINGAVGVICGWKIMGPRAGPGFSRGIGAGLTTSACIVIIALLIHGLTEMVRQALRKQFGSPLEAIVGVFEIAYEYGKIIAVPEIIASLVIGGIFGGIVTTVAARHWR